MYNQSASVVLKGTDFPLLVYANVDFAGKAINNCSGVSPKTAKINKVFGIN